MGYELPFDFELPVSFFEKADADPGKQRRIGGIASLETRDRQGELIIQRNLDFSDFLSNGWFNDNHSRATDGILGYPDNHSFFRKGQRLPDGTQAPANGHWVEGYLLDTPKAHSIWDLGQALQKTKRRLGFSVEGKIQKREGPQKQVIAKALVRNVAITNCPVNAGARMEILAKSLMATEQTGLEDVRKTLGMGTVTDPGKAPVGPQTGMGAGRVLAEEDLERDDQPKLQLEAPAKKDKKKLTLKKAVELVQKRFPRASIEQALRVVLLTRKQSTQKN